jgi:hypothetical protein
MPSDDERLGEPSGKANALGRHSLEQALYSLWVNPSPFDGLQQRALADASQGRLNDRFEQALGNRRMSCEHDP